MLITKTNAMYTDMLYESLRQQPDTQESVQRDDVSQILIVSKDDFAVHGMVSLLENHKDSYSVTVIEPENFTLAILNTNLPTAILINSDMPGLASDELIHDIHSFCSDVNVLLFGYGMTEEFLFKAMRAGARGYLNEKMRGDLLTTALDTVTNGGYWAERHILSQFISNKSLYDKIDNNIAQLYSRLTTRESEVLELILEGLTTNEIADKIYLSHQGVKAHLTNLFRKFEVKNRVQLILCALDLISPMNSFTEVASKGLKAARCKPKN